jgi:hypothetical protein
MKRLGQRLPFEVKAIGFDSQHGYFLRYLNYPILASFKKKEIPRRFLIFSASRPKGIDALLLLLFNPGSRKQIRQPDRDRLGRAVPFAGAAVPAVGFIPRLREFGSPI